REQGKMRAIARGAVRPGSSLGPCVEPLTRARFYCIRRRSLDLIAQAVPLASYGALKGELWPMACGLYMAELIDSSTAEDVPHPALYELVQAILGRFDHGETSESLLRYFEVRLLDQTGFRPSLQYCVECGTRLRPVDNALSPVLGGAVCPECAAHVSDARPLSLDALKVLRLWLDSSLDVAVRVRMNGPLAFELDTHIHRLLLGVLQKEIRSRGWLSRLKEEGLLTSSAGASTIASRFESE
ncbi:MAG: DNA repair protein RecO, partial [Chloroflexota bacterium]